MPELFCIGLGYTALALAERLMRRGWQVSGTCRSEDKAAALRRRGIHVRTELPRAARHVLVSVPPDETGDPGFAVHGEALAGRRDLAWLGYLSSTAVYGDRQGGWVDEDTAPAPGTERGIRRLAAERQWRGLEGIPVHVFRLAAIYGPGRSAFDALRAGRAQLVKKPGQVFSRIHVADLAAVLAASIGRPDPGRVYNLADDEPVPPDEVLVHAARLLGMPPPPEVPFEALGAAARSFYAENKRISNDRIKRELGVRLAYPSYREGLAAILATESSASAAPMR
jgi:nucleoside-diphosphate-sugar epimerase